uniref:Retrovirus-related Pol polyprotein from transposon TNT 1-94 n=1 Tax=Vitis vinifera TaxID=29760 RepID=A5BCG6_VITVI|nr:hypothetical protein VITISV_017116 [Vitis vinifera]
MPWTKYPGLHDKRNKLQGPSFGDFHIDLSRIVENGAPRVCYHNKFARRVDPKTPVIFQHELLPVEFANYQVTSGKGLQDALLGEKNLLNTMQEKEKTKLLEKAQSAIILSLGDTMLREVAKAKPTAELWLKLESLYMTKSLANRLHKKIKLYTFKITPGMSIEEHFDHFNKIILDLENIDITVSNEDKAILLLTSLDASYTNMKEAIMYGRDSMTFDEVQSILHPRELQKQEESKDESGEGLNIRGRYDKREKKCKNLKAKSKSNTKKFKCFICHKEGHFKKDCSDKRQNTIKKTVNEGDAAVILDGYDSAKVLNVAEMDSGKEWILDSGCSFHMCPIKAWFEDFKEANGGHVLLGNNKHCKILGTSIVRIKHYDGIERVLEVVRYIPELKRNLISLGMLDKLGYTFKSKPNSLRVARGSLTVMKGTIKNGLYTLIGQTMTGKVSIVLKEDMGITKLWHQRLGHINHKRLQEPQKQGVLGNYKLTDLPFCEHCVFSKATRVKFAKAVHETQNQLDYIHSNLWGPSWVPSLGGARVEILVETQVGRKVKKLRTDNELEFLSNDFNSFCQKEGIATHRTVRYTPQQNGLAERMNRTILERVRCMLSSLGLSKVFWVEAVETVVHLISRSPSSALQFKTPQEKWTGKVVDYQHLKVFGCTAYVHTKTDKLEPRAVKCIFLGYPKGVKGYKLWIKTQGKEKCIISKDSEMEYETSQPEKSTETSSETVQEEIVQERQDEPTRGLESYSLARDRQKRQVKPPKKYGQAEMTTFALSVAEEIVDMEPKTYQEAINSNEADHQENFGNGDRKRQEQEVGTRSLGLVYGGNSQLGTQLQGFVDADYVGNIDTRKSLTGYVFTVFGGAISWKANLQLVVALSTTEAEYMAMTEAVNETIWLKGITKELAMNRGKVVVYCDNQSAIHLAKNQSFHKRSKHIDVRLHFVRNIVVAGEI